MEILLYGLIGLFLSYFIIYIAIKDAINKTIQRYIKVQAELTILMAKNTGIGSEEIDKVILSPKEFKKKYSVKQVGEMLK